MFVEKVKSGKNYHCYLLRETFREDGKVKHRTIANLSKCSEQEISAIKLALKHKDDLSELVSIRQSISLKQGRSVGAVWTIYQIARELGIEKALGTTRAGKLALWQVIARVISQGSRLSAVRLAQTHSCCEILGVGAFDEDDLYSNLSWLAEKQSVIENRLFRHKKNEGVASDVVADDKVSRKGLYLYDVTSSYLEGNHNELSAFGYNRDGKRGKRQIVIGLLCDGAGDPLSIEVFPGNTHDTSTVESQLRKIAERFGAGDIIFVGDRGMIKSRQINNLCDYSFHYITAITKPQIRKLLKQGTIQMELFDTSLAEIKDTDGSRYILRRNPIRAEQLRINRQDKLASFAKTVQKLNAYLAEHSRADVAVALRKANEQAERLKISSYVRIDADVSERSISFSIDEYALSEISKLDGCYVLKTDVSEAIADKETIHERYKDLSSVELAFRTMKTAHLELRPVYVRKAERTRGHCFVVMLAYKIIRELAKRWKDFDKTVAEAIDELSMICSTEIYIDGRYMCNKISAASDSAAELLNSAGVILPEILPAGRVKVGRK